MYKKDSFIYRNPFVIHGNIKRLIIVSALLTTFVFSNGNSKELSYYLNQLDNHPKVLAVVEQRSSQLRLAEGALGLPDPALFLGVDNVPVSDPSFDRYLPSSKVFGFNQAIPNPLRRSAQQEIFLTSATSSEMLAEYTKSRLRALFFTRIADLKRVRQQLGYEEKKKSIISQLNNYYEGQILAGRPLYEKTYLSEIELTDVERKINSFHSEISTIEADLVQLVGEVPQADFHSEEKQWNGTITELYPVQLAARNIKIAEARVEFADSNYWPNFGVMGTYKVREEGVDNSFDGDDWFSIQLRMTVPLWGSKNQGPKLEAARSGKKSADHAYHEAVRRWTMEVTRLTGEREASRLNIAVLKKKDEVLQQKISAMERNYSAGEASLEPVLQTELAKLSLLSGIAEEEARFIRISQELNSHVIQREIDERR